MDRHTNKTLPLFIWLHSLTDSFDSDKRTDKHGQCRHTWYKLLFINYTGNFVSEIPPSSMLSCLFLWFSCWLCLWWALIGLRVDLPVSLWECFSITFYLCPGCGWEQRHYSSSRNWSLCLLKLEKSISSLFPSFAGVSPSIGNRDCFFPLIPFPPFLFLFFLIFGLCLHYKYSFFCPFSCSRYSSGYMCWS